MQDLANKPKDYRKKAFEMKNVDHHINAEKIQCICNRDIRSVENRH